MAPRNHLRGYDVYWYGPYGHESRDKAAGLNVLSGHISRAFKEAKIVTEPHIHEVQITFDEHPEPLHIHPRHPKTNWLHWRPDYRDLETLCASADNATVGEHSIELARNLQKQLHRQPNLVRGFPHDAMEKAIAQFRSENYSITGRLGGNRKIYASPMTVRLFLHMTCLKTTVSIGFYLKRKELHLRDLISFEGGAWDSAHSLGGINVYDGQLRLFCVDTTQPPPNIAFAELPEEVRKYLPTNSEIEKAWETGPDPMGRYLSKP